MLRHVAVLGAGIMGVSTALFLARRGRRVTVFDAAPRPLARASRWNEGKIHLGYLYAADTSLATVRRLLPGGLAFKPLIESLIGESVAPAVTSHDDTFLVHRESVADVAQVSRYFDAVTCLANEHPQGTDYLQRLGAAKSHRLSKDELEAVADCRHIIAGFRVPERSVLTAWVADRLVAALDAEPAIDVRLDVTVRGVRSKAASVDGPLHVLTSSGPDGPYDAVVNALWEGRLAVDATLGLPMPPIWSHRYRVCAFLRMRDAVDVPSVVVCTGPFGDVKNYNGRDFYVSWYPCGLLVDSSALIPPEAPRLDTAACARLTGEIVASLADIVPPVRRLAAGVESCRLEGGWVYAAGGGQLSDPSSTLHRRDRADIRRDGSYISVDTGKYSMAPWLAQQIADALTA